MRKTRKTRTKVLAGVVASIIFLVLCGWYLSGLVIPVLQPAGPIAEKQYQLMAFCVALSFIIVIPVFGLLAFFSWKYRESNTKAPYEPELDGNRRAETIWWLIPSAMIALISVIIWQSSYALDPYKAIATNKPTLHVQVVSLDWKWLFIYPGQNVASVNEVAIPVGTNVDFEITSDTVMTSFWVPSLAGQMYAMPGMTTHLNMLADKPGNYMGVTANISGKGFADMKFTVKALEPSAYAGWMARGKQAKNPLTTTTFTELARPTIANKQTFYSPVSSDVYTNEVNRFMHQHGTTTHDEHMNGMEM